MKLAVLLFVSLALFGAIQADNININFGGLLGNMGGVAPPPAPGPSKDDVIRQQQDTINQLQTSVSTMKNKLALLGFKEQGSYAPIPAAASPFGQAQPDGMYYGEPTPGNGVYFVTDSAYTSAVVDCGTSVVVIDSPPSFGTRLPGVVAKIAGNKPISHFIFTHAHNDHIAQASLFVSPNTVMVASETTATLLKRNPLNPIPTLLIKNNGTKLTIGNKNFVFYDYLNAHVEGNLAIHLPDQRVFVYIDVVFSRWAPFFGLGFTQDAYRYVEMFDILLSLDFDWLLAGHLGRPAFREDILQGRQYLKDMEQYIREGFKLFTFQDGYKNWSEKGPIPNHWAVINNVYGDMAFYCSQKIVEKWKTVIGGADVYAWSQCWNYREAISLFGNVAE